jgi:LL-diaminopimelate aminotransferase
MTAVQALIRAAESPDSHGYQNYKGTPSLRAAIASYYRKTYGVDLNADTMILPLIGSKEGIMHIAMAFVNEGEEVLIPDPGYPTYASVARLTGATIRTYEMKESLGWHVDFEGLEKQDLSKVKIMWVNFPHMPTGHVASRDEMKRLVDLARKHQFLIVNDNPYSMILNDSPLSILSIEGANEVALELNSLSKSHNMAGWRIGWLAGRQEFVEAVLRVKSNMDSGMFLGLQQAAVEALQSDRSWFEELNTIYRGRRVVAMRILDELGCTYSEKQSGLFLWARAPQAVHDVEQWVDTILYTTKVFVTPGFIFGDGGRNHIRISLCATVEKMEQALERIRHWKKSNIGAGVQHLKLKAL